MGRHSVGGHENGEEASVGNSRHRRQRRLRNLTNGEMFINQGDFDEEGEEGTENANNIDDANMEHGKTNGLVPTVNDLDRQMISPAYAMICDTRMLDCCVCFKPLSSPVFQV
ncbi:E3 ubiquitin-protein ligase [Sesbania bispinosa]|nr:E3 ubiquitin-protein ligase [Sesbania bispinosa]